MPAWLQSSDLRGWVMLPIGLLVSAALVRLAIGYAQRRNMLDAPGRRRSHVMPTPRGGGAGIVVSILICGGLLPLVVPGTPRNGSHLDLPAVLGVALVAGVGWIDDHRPLSARIRFAIHLLAAALWLLFPLFTGASSPLSELLPADAAWLSLRLGVLVAVAAVAIVWSINLHNFMDGINGLLASQAVFVFSVLGVLVLRNDGAQAKLLFLFGAATLGFLPFNFPSARIFMGDVGSGALGFLVAIAIVQGAKGGWTPVLGGLIAVSAFVVDATCTLLSRMLRGRRWYSAHREHLYQWLVRIGYSHARVVGWYMAWNLFVVVPVLYVAVMPGRSATAGIAWSIAVYALACVVWGSGKRWCLSRARPSSNNN